jgi:hypothetical protein
MHGIIIQKRLLEQNIIPQEAVPEFERLGMIVSIIDLDMFDELIGHIDSNVQFWTSISTIKMQRFISKFLSKNTAHHLPLFCSELHYYSKYIHQVPPKFRLNNNGLMLPLAEIKNICFDHLSKYLGSYQCHIRPDNALKIAEAQVISINTESIDNFINDTLQFSSASETSIFWIFPRKDIVAEYRLAIRNNKAIASSAYPHDILKPDDIEKTVPDDVISFGNMVARTINISDEIYVMDIARDTKGQLYFLELNCMSTSGWYKMNVQTLCSNISDELLKAIENYF